MVFALGATTLASDTTEINQGSTDKTGATNVTYPVDAKYTVTIPAAVTLSKDSTVNAEIKAESVLLEANKKIVVTLTGASNTQSGNTFNAKSGDSTATYTITKDSTQIALNDTVAEFTADNTQVLVFSKADNTSVTVAGDHTETLTFTIAVVAPVPVTGVTLNKTTLELTAGGDTATLTATITPDTATDKTVTWSSSDTSVATVDNGVVTPVAAGTATITATAGGETATCTVTVKAGTRTVTWNSDVLQGSGVIERDGITLTPSNGDARLYDNFYDYGMNTFTAPNGTNFKKIEIVCSSYGGGWSGATEEVIGSYQPYPEEEPDYWRDIIKVTWTGDSSEVSFTSSIFGVQSITFTLG
jgi:uncharacterized protein YjdB